jgi:hypothetical protein
MATPQVLRNRYHERRIPVVVERTTPDQIRTVAAQLHTLGLHQAYQRHHDTSALRRASSSDRLAAIAQLDDTDRQTITNTIDALTTRNQLRTINTGAGQ